MTKYTFKLERCGYEYHNRDTIVEEVSIVQHGDPGLEELLESITSFLKACGYSIDGVLDLISDDTDEELEQIRSEHDDEWDGPEDKCKHCHPTETVEEEPISL